MLYLTDSSTASKMLNLKNVAKSSAKEACFRCRDLATSRRNPIQETVRFCSVGPTKTLLLSFPEWRKTRWLSEVTQSANENKNVIGPIWQKSVILYSRAFNKEHELHEWHEWFVRIRGILVQNRIRIKRYSPRIPDRKTLCNEQWTVNTARGWGESHMSQVTCVCFWLWVELYYIIIYWLIINYIIID